VVCYDEVPDRFGKSAEEKGRSQVTNITHDIIARTLHGTSKARRNYRRILSKYAIKFLSLKDHTCSR
jgi:hypothetical protein